MKTTWKLARRGLLINWSVKPPPGVGKAALAPLWVVVLLFCPVSASPAPKPPTDKPTVTQIEPRGIQRGVETRIKLTGTNLNDLLQLKSANPKLKGELLADTQQDTEAWISLLTAADLERGSYEFSLANTNGESGIVKVQVDDLPQVSERESEKAPPVVTFPVGFWGTFNSPGDIDEFEFVAKAGQSLVFDVAAKSLGSKAGAALELFDATGALVASGGGLDGGDALLSFKSPAAGRYRLRLHEPTAAGSPEHFYRVSVGELPVVTGIFPLGITAKIESEVQLIGVNLPPDRTVRLRVDQAGEQEVPIDPERFRSRRDFRVLVQANEQLVETEPNDSLPQAGRMPAPGVVNGRIWAAKGQAGDVDLFSFDAKAGENWVIETDAARRGSPIDTKFEVLHQDGRPVERVRLQAVRDSSITFRPIDSNADDLRVENWREMELTQFLYMNGEVGRIFRMPQGPDSGFQLFNRGGKRRCYFDTSGMAHALDEPCYIVEPHPPGAKLVANGLPVFPLYYANDDDGERKLGLDSRVHFTAPVDGTYLIRVSDTRGQGGERFAYRLVIRAAKPDFNLTPAPTLPTVAPGSGQAFVLTADRMDGFDGEIRVDIGGLPQGFVCSTPILIQAGHLTASGTIHAASDAPEPPETKLVITATAMVNGQKLTKEVRPAGKIKLGEKPKLLVMLEPDDAANTNFVERPVPDPHLAITIAPGQILPAWIKIKRDGHTDLVTFTVDNLPHGVIVDNIGLNGVLIPKGQDERQIFFSAAKWVEETDRLVYAQAKQAGNPTSLPVWLRVRNPAEKSVANAK